MQNQDWTPVVFHKKPDTVRRVEAPQTFSATTAKPAWKIEQQEDLGVELKRVCKEDTQRIIQGRVNKKLCQKDLATKLNMQLKDIQEIENGKALENKQQLAKIKKFLQI